MLNNMFVLRQQLITDEAYVAQCTVEQYDCKAEFETHVVVKWSCNWKGDIRKAAFESAREKYYLQ